MEASNVKAMREALMEASIALSSATHHHMTEDDAKDCLAVIETAISAPPRNCDVGTVDEQRDRLESFCAIHFRYSADNPCSGCPIYNGDSRPCVYRFLQMPYEEGGTK